MRNIDSSALATFIHNIQVDAWGNKVVDPNMLLQMQSYVKNNYPSNISLPSEIMTQLFGSLLAEIDKAMPESIIKYIIGTLERLFGEEHVVLSNLFTAISKSWIKAGKLSDALEISAKALLIRMSCCGLVDEKTADSHYNIGLIYRLLGDFTKSRKELLICLNIRESVFGSDSLPVANCLLSLGQTEKAAMYIIDSYSYLFRCVRIRKNILGSKHPQTLSAYNMLQSCSRYSGGRLFSNLELQDIMNQLKWNEGDTGSLSFAVSVMFSRLEDNVYLESKLRQLISNCSRSSIARNTEMMSTKMYSNLEEQENLMKYILACDVLGCNEKDSDDLAMSQRNEDLVENGSLGEILPNESLILSSQSQRQPHLITRAESSPKKDLALAITQLSQLSKDSNSNRVSGDISGPKVEGTPSKNVEMSISREQSSKDDMESDKTMKSLLTLSEQPLVSSPVKNTRVSSLDVSKRASFVKLLNSTGSTKTMSFNAMPQDDLNTPSPKRVSLSKPDSIKTPNHDLAVETTSTAVIENQNKDKNTNDPLIAPRSPTASLTLQLRSLQQLQKKKEVELYARSVAVQNTPHTPSKNLKMKVEFSTSQSSPAIPKNEFICCKDISSGQFSIVRGGSQTQLLIVRPIELKEIANIIKKKLSCVGLLLRAVEGKESIRSKPAVEKLGSQPLSTSEAVVKSSNTSALTNASTSNNDIAEPSKAAAKNALASFLMNRTPGAAKAAVASPPLSSPPANVSKDVVGEANIIIPTPPPLPRQWPPVPYTGDESEVDLMALLTTSSKEGIGGDNKNKPMEPPGPKMKQVALDKIEKIEGTIWEEAQDNLISSQELFADFEEEFSLSSKTAKKAPVKAATTPQTKATRKPEGALDPQRSQNLSIMLAKFGKKNISDVVKAVAEFDMVSLGASAISVLLQFLPTSEEAKSIEKLETKIKSAIETPTLEPTDNSNTTSNTLKLSKPEQYLLEMSRVLNLEKKLSTMLVCLSSRETVKNITSQIEAVGRAGDEVKDSTRLKFVLKSILDLNNMILTKSKQNGGQTLAGFKLSSLSKLCQTKTNSGETIEQYVVAKLYAHMPEALNMSGDAPSLEDGRQVAFPRLRSELSQIQNAIKDMELICEDPKEEEDVKTKIQHHLQECKHLHQRCHQSLQDAEKEFQEVCAYFGEPPTEPEILLSMLQRFFQSVENATNIVAAKVKRLKRQQ